MIFLCCILDSHGCHSNNVAEVVQTKDFNKDRKQGHVLRVQAGFGLLHQNARKTRVQCVWNEHRWSRVRSLLTYGAQHVSETTFDVQNGQPVMYIEWSRDPDFLQAFECCQVIPGATSITSHYFHEKKPFCSYFKRKIKERIQAANLDGQMNLRY